MDVFLTDIEIKSLIDETKQMTVDPAELLHNMKDKRGHSESEYNIVRSDGSTFSVRLRINNENPLDFSIILAFCPANSSKLFLIRRYNGKSHEHKNKLEGEEAFYNYHIHTATERYQREGTKEEYFAEETNRYSTALEALNCLMTDCNIISPPTLQYKLEM